MTTSTASRAARSAGFNVTGAALAILFLFPLVWSGWSSVKGQPGSAQPSGFGFGNYCYLASYGEGVATYLVNSAAVTAMTVGARCWSPRSAATASPASCSRARTCCSWRRSPS